MAVPLPHLALFDNDDHGPPVFDEMIGIGLAKQLDHRDHVVVVLVFVIH